MIDKKLITTIYIISVIILMLFMLLVFNSIINNMAFQRGELIRIEESIICDFRANGKGGLTGACGEPGEGKMMIIATVIR